MVRQRGQYIKNFSKKARFQAAREEGSEDEEEAMPAPGDEEDDDVEDQEDRESDGDEDGGGGAGASKEADEAGDAGPSGKGDAMREDDEDDEDEDAEAEGEEEEEEGGEEEDDEEDEDEDEEEEDEEEEDAEGEETPKKKKSSKKKRKASVFIDDAAEEDGDDDEDEDEAPRKKKKKKGQEKPAKKTKRSEFIDDMAEVEGDDDEDEGDEGIDDLIDDDEQAEAEKVESQLQHVRQAQYEQRQRDMEMEVEDVEAFVKQRWGSGARQAQEDVELEEVSATRQQRELPTVKDPKLWMVTCKIGRERELVMSLMAKYIAMQEAGEPLLIKSAITQDHLKGYIYVESDKEDYVKNALSGLRGIFFSKKFRLVPIDEMVDGITVLNKGSGDSIKPDSWVRLRSGIFKGDLAKVVELHSAEVPPRVTVKVVPRIDYEEMLTMARNEQQVKLFGKLGEGRMRPVAKLFNADDLGRESNVIVEKDKLPPSTMQNLPGIDRVDIIEGRYFFSEGYLVRNIALAACTLETAPSLDELQRFTGGGAGNATTATELAAMAAAISDKKRTQVTFAPGDAVIVVDGDLKDLEGVVDSVTPEGDQVMVLPSLKELADKVLAFTPSQLQKYFKSGDKVMVTSGRHEGQTGLVVAVDGNVCSVFTDLSNEEIEVFLHDLADASHMSAAIEKIGSYEMHNLVLLDEQTVGCIIKVEKEAALLLTNTSTPDRPDVRTCRLVELKQKLNTKRATAQDSRMNTVNSGSMVNITGGPARGKQGTVLHVHRGLLFLRCRDIHENGGVICVRARQCLVHGSSSSSAGPANKGPAAMGGAAGAPMGGGMTPLMSPAHYLGGSGGLGAPPSRSGMMQSPRADGAGGGPPGAGRFGGGPGGRRQNQMIGQMVQISKGPYRGYQGRVVDCTDTTARLEVQAKGKIITVNLAQIQQPGAQQQAGGRPGFPAAGGMTPAHLGSRTPAYGGMTPAHGGMTPGHGGGMTPSRLPYGARTPNPWSDGGGMTPQHPGATPRGGGSSNVFTPSLYGAGTPSGNAATPSQMGMSPYVASTPSAVGGYAPSPNLPTPTAGLAYGVTPGGAGGVPTPASIVGATPGLAPTPGGAGAADSASFELSQWGGAITREGLALLPGLVVKLSDSEQGVLEGVPAPGGVVSVRIGSQENGRIPDRQALTAEVRQVAATDLEIVKPAKKDLVRVVHGPQRGEEASLIGVDGADGIIKMASSAQDINILDLAHLGRVLDERQ
mmetsp:Transcript_6930/g.23018  ORF Transcript_6930/g.23018 Transcript_6930/m.23018 type:complete len:1237 (+) Transcript_6930:184-3894(+)